MKSLNLSPVNPSSINNGPTKRARLIGAAATAAATAVLALTFVLDLNGCSSTKSKPNVAVQSNQNNGTQSSASANPSVVTQPASIEQKVEAVVAKKKVIKKVSTIAYKNSTYGVSFRFPKTYTMLTPEKDSQESAWPDPVAMNFTGSGGETLTTLVLPGTRASSYFKASVNKNLNAEQCTKFATVPELTEVATNPSVDANPPVDANDDSIHPAKANVLGVEFSKVENVTEQSEARYYHHYENGSCYEFALGVEDAPGTIKPIDHLQVFDKLERIMTTVKIKSEPAPAVAVSTPVQQPVSNSNPQQ